MAAFREAVLDLVPRVKERSDEAERQRSIPARTIADLRQIGAFRAFVPRKYGGDERTPSEVLDAFTVLGTACASTAWVASLLAVHNIAVCWLQRQGQDEIFDAGPDVLVSSSVAPTGTLNRTTGGFRLAGRWGFSSAVDHASWIMLGANLRSQSAAVPPDYFLCFVRASEVTLLDDWHVSGLRATGSKSLELGETFVPEHRALLLRSVREGSAPGLALHASRLYRLPWESVFVCGLAPAALGIAMAMLQVFRDYTATRVNRFSGQRFRANPGSAMRIAEAAALIDVARLMFRRDLASLDRFVQAGEPPVAGNTERISYDVPFIVDTCSRAVLQLYRGSGAAAIHESHPIQRYFRDIHAITQHAALDTDRAGEVYGRALVQDPALRIGADA